MTPSEIKARIYTRIKHISEVQLKRFMEMIEREFFPDLLNTDQTKNRIARHKERENYEQEKIRIRPLQW